MMDLFPDRHTAARAQLEFLFGNREGAVCLATLDQPAAAKGRNPWAQRYFAYPSEVASFLDAAFRAAGKGLDVYVGHALYAAATRNGRRDEDIVYRCGPFLDVDGPGTPLESLQPPPALVVETSPGKYQAYWRTEGDVPDTTWVNDTTKRLAHHVKGGDHNVYDSVRVLRLAGTANRKTKYMTPANGMKPPPVRIVHYDDHTTPREAFAYLPPAPQSSKITDEDRKSPLWTHELPPLPALREHELPAIPEEYAVSIQSKTWHWWTQGERVTGGDKSDWIFWMAALLAYHNIPHETVLLLLLQHPTTRKKWPRLEDARLDICRSLTKIAKHEYGYWMPIGEFQLPGYVPGKTVIDLSPVPSPPAPTAAPALPAPPAGSASGAPNGHTNGAAYCSDYGVPFEDPFAELREKLVLPENAGEPLVIAQGADDLDRQFSALLAQGPAIGDSEPFVEENVFAAPLDAINAARDAAHDKMRARFRSVGPSEVVAMPKPPSIIPGFLPKGELSVLFGDTGIGKTFLSLYLAYCVATGRPFAGRPVEQGLVMYLSGEGYSGIGVRLFAMHHYWQLPEYPDQTLRFFENMPLFKLNGAADFDAFRVVCEELQEEWKLPITLTIWDTYSRAMVGGDENSSRDSSEVMHYLEELRKALHVTQLLIHHTGLANKDRERGSNVLSSWANTRLRLERITDELDGQIGDARLTNLKYRDGREGDFVDFMPLPYQDSLVYVPRESNAEPELKDYNETDVRYLEALMPQGVPQDMTLSEWTAALGVAPSTRFNERRAHLEQIGYIRDVPSTANRQHPNIRITLYGVNAVGTYHRLRTGGQPAGGS